MRIINKPDILQEDICDSLSELHYRDRVIEKSNDYEELLLDPDYLLKDEEVFLASDSEYYKHMKKMYSERFSSSSKTYENSYFYYRKIRDAEKICPYCNYITRVVIVHPYVKTNFEAIYS